MDKIEKLIEEQRKNYEKLLELSSLLLKLLKEKGDKAKPEALMKERDGVINAVKKVEKRLKKYEGDIQPGHKGAERIGKIIEKIMKLDRQSMELLEAGKTNLRKEMKSVQKRGAAVKDYMRKDGSGGSGRFISIKE